MVRSDKYNALDWDMLCALVDTAEKIGRNKSLRAVILQGEGKAFCSGLDFPSFTKQPAKMVRGFLKYGVKTTNLFQEVAWCWRRLPVPVIAVIHGYCYGGGVQIALGADFRYTTPDCEFSILEAKWGLVPDMTGTVTLRELLPMDQAKLLTMTGRMFDGTEARALNLVTGVSADPLAEASDWWPSSRRARRMRWRQPSSCSRKPGWRACAGRSRRSRASSSDSCWGVTRRLPWTPTSRKRSRSSCRGAEGNGRALSAGAASRCACAPAHFRCCVRNRSSAFANAALSCALKLAGPPTCTPLERSSSMKLRMVSRCRMFSAV